MASSPIDSQSSSSTPLPIPAATPANMIHPITQEMVHRGLDLSQTMCHSKTLWEILAQEIDKRPWISSMTYSKLVLTSRPNLKFDTSKFRFQRRIHFLQCLKMEFLLVNYSSAFMTLHSIIPVLRLQNSWDFLMQPILSRHWGLLYWFHSSIKTCATKIFKPLQHLSLKWR